MSPVGEKSHSVEKHCLNISQPLFPVPHISYPFNRYYFDLHFIDAVTEIEEEWVICQSLTAKMVTPGFRL